MSNEIKLPSGDPEDDIRHLKRLSIYVKSEALVPARTLEFNILGYTAEDRDDSGGTLITPGQWPDGKINDFLEMTAWARTP